MIEKQKITWSLNAWYSLGIMDLNFFLSLIFILHEFYTQK